MKFGLQIYSFTWPGGPETIGPTLARAVRTADDLGFDSIWVMDHFWQILRGRFDMLEDTLRMAHGMWEGERGSEAAFQGRRFEATRLVNVPQSISRPRVPILVGGGGERRTLRLVAQYADASNLFGGPAQLLPKYAILAEQCAAVGRDFAEIERTSTSRNQAAAPMAPRQVPPVSWWSGSVCSRRRECSTSSSARPMPTIRRQSSCSAAK